jgi:putative spermidine/putrescine transport system permease protein
MRADGAPRRTAWRALLLVALAATTLVPFAWLIAASVAERWFFPALRPAGVTLASWEGAWAGPLLGSAARSVWLAALAGALATAAGFAVGRGLARLRGWRRRVAAGLAFLPVAAPPAALATGAQLFFLRAGVAGTAAGVLLAHLIPAAAYLTLFFAGVFEGRDGHAEEEARTLGATPWQALTRVTLPSLRRELGEAWALGFLVSWAQVATTQLVGGGRVHTLALDVFDALRAGSDREAAVGALLLAVPPLLALAAARAVVRRGAPVAP